MRTFTDLPPLSLYIHIPWCLKKCPYCDFNSHEQRRDTLPESEYIQALLSDLEQEVPTIWGRQIISVFVGGGTPSLFSPDSLDRLLSGVRALTALAPTIETTLEANPGTFEQAKFHGFRAAGFNRLSIGIQSFNDRQLRALGRVHDGYEAHRAVEIARAAGFDNLNLDLMFGLPEQSLADAVSDLDKAILLAPEHLSYYQLTLEPNTSFAHHPPALPDDELIWDQQSEALSLLAQHGYQRYEISAYARAGRTSVHNTNYWQYGDYIGIGAGAHGKISSAMNGRIHRYSKVRHPQQYLATAATPARIQASHEVPLADTTLEFMMNALRMVDGFALPLYARHTGTELHASQPVIDRAIDDGLLEQIGLTLRPTPRGLDFLNELLERFMPASTTETSNTRQYPVIPLRPSRE